MAARVLLAALLAAFASATSFIQPMGLHLLPEDVANSTGAVCLDGSPPGFYFTKASDPAKADKWVIFFRGGGWCYDEKDCLNRAKTALGSTRDLTTDWMMGGIMNSDQNINPEFAGYNRVLLWYCDGASFSGNRDTPINVNGTNLYFRGHRILDELFGFLRYISNTPLCVNITPPLS